MAKFYLRTSWGGGEADQVEGAEEERKHFADVDGPPNAIDAHQGGKRPDGGHLEHQRTCIGSRRTDHSVLQAREEHRGEHAPTTDQKTQ